MATDDKKPDIPPLADPLKTGPPSEVKSAALSHPLTGTVTSMAATAATTTTTKSAQPSVSTAAYHNVTLCA